MVYCLWQTNNFWLIFHLYASRSLGVNHELYFSRMWLKFATKIQNSWSFNSFEMFLAPIHEKLRIIFRATVCTGWVFLFSAPSTTCRWRKSDKSMAVIFQLFLLSTIWCYSTVLLVPEYFSVILCFTIWNIDSRSDLKMIAIINDGWWKGHIRNVEYTLNPKNPCFFLF